MSFLSLIKSFKQKYPHLCALFVYWISWATCMNLISHSFFIYFAYWLKKMLSFLQNRVALLVLLNLHKVHIQFLVSKLICTQDQWFPLTIEDAIITPLLSNLTLIIKQNVLTPCFFQSLTFSIEFVFLQYIYCKGTNKQNN